MPPERRALVPPPRTPLALAIPTPSRRTSITAAIPSSSPSSKSLAGTPSFIHPPDSSMSSYLSNRHAKGTLLNKAYIHQRSLSKQEQLRFELQKRHHQSRQQFNQLKTAQQEFHRQREAYHQQQLQARQQQQQQHPHHILAPGTDGAPSTVSTSSSYSSSYTPVPNNPSPLSRHGQHSGWTTVHEEERALQSLSSSSSSSLPPSFSFSNISNTIVPLPITPLPPQIARDNLRRLSERLQRRRTRARETIMYDLHQGAKSVEAQVHRQVEMVLSRLKEAPGSRYAFALTNSLLSQLPIAASLLPSLPSVGDEPSQVESPEDQERIRERERYRAAAESLSNGVGSIALTGHPPPASSISPSSSSSSSTSQPEGERQVSISRSGASEFLSASMHTSYSTAASQVLSAALPSFIPSMVAPLVCVFSYPAPSSSSSLTASPGDPASAQQQQKDFVFPWGLPDRPPPPYQSPLPHRARTGQREEHLQQQRRPFNSATSNPGFVVGQSNFWTQAEREALHLAVTRFRLAGQWSKIREMMNLHRADEEIEREYVKLYGHRTGIKDDEEDEDDGIDSWYRDGGYQSGRDESHRKKDDREGRFGNMDSDADDEAETGGGALFGKVGGSRRPTASHPHPPQSHYHHQRQLQQVQDSSGAGALRAGYGLQPVVDPRQRLAVMQEPILMHKKDHMTDRQFTLEDIPMRL